MGIVLYQTAFGADVVMMDEDYFKEDVRNTQVIFTRQNKPFAQHAAGVEELLQPMYERMYGYKMDEKLFVVLASQKNQIPNGFSTQYPNNRQVNYIGGVLLTDYFSTSSWLDTLLYHETAHNYQANAKDNPVSSMLHAVLANGAFFVPFFTVPNAFEGSFMAEGNAVLNESWHAIGGRLYSGRFKIETLMQAKAHYLTPERIYNDNYFFLYGSHFYTLGGFYHYYLAQKYGLKKVNAYWKNHSHYWFWPFFTNNSMEESIGVDFETSVKEWASVMEEEAKKVHVVNGDVLATTQFFTPLNSDDSQIYTLINQNGRERPAIFVYDKKNGVTSFRSGAWMDGKVVKTSFGFATQSYNYTDPWHIYIGLYDANGEILPATQLKVIEGYTEDGKEVWFDVASSYMQPKLYVGDRFYTTANSSVFIDGGDLYYCMQEGKNRTIYKNKTPLYRYKGYYGHVVGVDSKGWVYFIANTKHGSALFRYKAGKTQQAIAGDTIIDARLIDDTHALVATVGSNSYKLQKVALAPIEKKPYEVKLFFEKKPYYAKADRSKIDKKAKKLSLNKPFTPLGDLHYSAGYLAFGYDVDAGFVYNASVNFSDPFMWNTLGFGIARDLNRYTLAQASYANSRYFADIYLDLYGVVDKPSGEKSKDFGVFASVNIPFLRHGYLKGDFRTSYYQDYQSYTREPLSAVASLEKTERFGVSMYPDFRLKGDLFYSNDRGDNAYGGALRYTQVIGNETYMHVKTKFAKSDATTPLFERGVKVIKDVFETYLLGDPSSVVMPSLKETLYQKSAWKASFEARKVLNFSRYFFTFPISLRRESLIGGYNYYKLEDFRRGVQNDNELKVGILLDTYWMNLLPVLLTLEYRYNDNAVLAKEHNIRFFAGVSF